MNTTGERLRALRESLGITQAELSTRLATIGIRFSQARLSRLERGWIEPTANLKVSLARALNVPVDALDPPTDNRAPRATRHDTYELYGEEVEWILDRLPPPQRAILISRLKANQLANVAAMRRV